MKEETKQSKAIHKEVMRKMNEVMDINKDQKLGFLWGTSSLLFHLYIDELIPSELYHSTNKLIQKEINIKLKL